MAENITVRQRKPWIEPVIAFVMALTTLCTAWCSYESAAWTRHVNRLMNDSNALERKAALLDVQGSQALIVHASMFMQLLAAYHAGNEKLVSFYAERFPPDVKKAYDAWLAQKPFDNPSSDPHPFVPKLLRSPRGSGSGRGEERRCPAVDRSARSRQSLRPVSREYGPLCHRALLRRDRRQVRATASPPCRGAFRSRGLLLCRGPDAPDARRLTTALLMQRPITNQP